MLIKKFAPRAPALAFSFIASLAGFTNLAHAVDLPAPAGWTLQWGDNFAGPAGTLPSNTNWRIDTGHGYPNGPIDWGTSEIENYTSDPANIHLDGHGHLMIIPRRDASGQWTSGRIETLRDDFTAPDGGMLRMEARIQMPDVTGPRALGYWPAFWALGSSYRTTMAWPRAGEFDIMESVNGLDSVWGILHCGMNPGGPCGEPIGIGSRLPCPHEACTAGPHTFTFEWNRSVTPEQLRWFVDGQLVNQVAENQLSADTWRSLTQQRGYFMLLDVAMGGGFSFVMAGWKPTPTPQTEPGHSMVVDYVAVWTRPGTGKKVPAATEMAAEMPKRTPPPVKR
ncbi:family 16 glycosylhydrolase [Dyella jejuensis]|uniref:Family 16 glycosylhydrolase n=1 Tax=Dyella jejuensis TaxID=1432009 RepID=A0ABW8JLG9_9GAMM